MNEETKCPKCGESGPLIQRIVNALRCGACGEIFNLERNPISAAAEQRRREGVQGNWRAATGRPK